ncbi:MAG: DUF1800 domain-containing protein [Bacteroidetes bacterium]|nr:DUF1800 domain-containing protein [Bacteroidota bacterium]
MKRRFLFLTALLLTCGAFLWIAATNDAPPPRLDPLPYAEAGLTDREAAAHLLSRFTYGARPGDVDRVVEMGLETWLDRQLSADFSDKSLEKKLAPFKALDLSATEIAETYPPPFFVLRMAARDGGMAREELQGMEQRERRRTIRQYMDDNGLRPQRELIAELIGQKVLRATYTENQLAEVLTDFWFNHFNVALQDNQARTYVLAYERDAIRPHVLGSFREMLGATAKHPAMLLYLDNAQSTSPEGVATTMDARLKPYEEKGGLGGRIARRRIRQGRERMQREQDEAMQEIPEEFRPRRGINENYARELMELHTLGVNGGYTQQDVEEVARAFTGWTVVPPGERGERARKRMDRRGERMGFLLEEAFLFRADAHDATEKTILGETFPAGGGLDEGERVLDLVAAHASTARHLAQKLAARFVSDDPPEELVDELAEVFLTTDGDLPAVIRAMAYSPHFWSEETLRAKVKSPFELAISALRALDADVRPTRELVEWIDKMGQPLYRYQAPTGFPDEAGHWINAGALLNRMNFGLQLATGKIDGARFDLLALNGHREPETIEEALATYVPLLLPERDTAETTALLLPMAIDPGLEDKLNASTDDQPAHEMDRPDDLAGLDDTRAMGEEISANNPASLARTIGVILGSPAFQRR